MNTSRSTQPTAHSSNQPYGPPLGGSSGDWRYRILRFHVPLALASAVVLVLFMTLPPFDPQAYPQVDMMAGGVIPQPASEMGHGGGQTGSMDDGGDQTGSMGHAGSQTPPSTDQGGDQTGSTGHSGGQTGQTDHSGGQTGSMDGGENQTGQTDHSGGQTGSMDPDEMQEEEMEGRQGRFDAQRLTRATGYVALSLLGLTLLIGPANLLLRRRTPISSYLTRDVGIWAAVFSVVHVIFGLLMHSGGQIGGMLAYFIAPDGNPLTDSFGLGNWIGLAATVIVVGLLAISNDFALRKLKARTWKTLQRLNYALFALVILHAFFYGALLRTTSPFTLLLGLSVSAVFIGQMVGVWLWRRRHIRRTRERQSAGAAP